MTAEEKLRNPPPGSKIEAAQRYGVDLSLLIERLRLTPAERLDDLQRVMEDFEALRAAGRKKRSSSGRGWPRHRASARTLG